MENKNKLCERCRQVTRANANLQTISTEVYSRAIARYKHYPSFKIFEKSALAGCHMCVLCFNQVPLHLRPYLRQIDRAGRLVFCRDFSERTECVPPLGDHHIYMWYALQRGAREPNIAHAGDFHEGWFSMRLELTVPGEVERKGQLIDDSQAISNFTGFGSGWETAVRWINDCIANHPKCLRRKVRSCAAPSRLLDVGSKIDFSDVRLCTRAGFEEAEPKYVTLSHCWGNELPLQLTQSTQSVFMKQIPYSHLPKTFQDAIVVTRNMLSEFGVKYLWIDSLCILQDSVEDWEDQATHMGEIYQNSFCNLAATAALSGQFGMLFERNPLSLFPCLVKFVPPMPCGAKDLCEGQHESYCCERWSPWSEEVSDSPLLKRAWVVQERFLAPRMLHFHLDKLYFECSHLEASEAYPWGSQRFTVKAEKSRILTDVGSSSEQRHQEHGDVKLGTQDLSANSNRAVSTPLDGLCNLRFHATWARIVHMYASTFLSRAQDKLVAIAGVAKAVERQMGVTGSNEYLAGLWKNGLITQLLWSVGLGKNLDLPASVYRAPSWSWAALDASIFFYEIEPEAEYRSFVTILDAETVPVGSDNFLGVKAGFIRLSGSLVRAELRGVDPDYNFCGLEIAGTPTDRTTVTLDYPMETPAVFIIPFVLCKRSNGSEMVGLVLRNTPDQRDQYTRCGLFESRNSSRSWEYDNIFAEAVTRELTESELEERVGQKQSTIIIV